MMKLSDVTLMEGVPKAIKIHALLCEDPHSNVRNAPAELELLNGFVDFGFENMGFSKSKYASMRLAFASIGLKIPKTKYKLVYEGAFTKIVEAVGNEPELPDNWMSYIYVLDRDDRLKFVGSNVRPDQIRGLDTSHLNQFSEVGSSFVQHS